METNQLEAAVINTVELVLNTWEVDKEYENLLSSIKNVRKNLKHEINMLEFCNRINTLIEIELSSLVAEASTYEDQNEKSRSSKKY